MKTCMNCQINILKIVQDEKSSVNSLTICDKIVFVDPHFEILDLLKSLFYNEFFS